MKALCRAYHPSKPGCRAPRERRWFEEEYRFGPDPAHQLQVVRINGKTIPRGAVALAVLPGGKS
jgi:hypothetical protein